MATRKTQVPGATPEPVEEVQPQQELVETPQEQEVQEPNNEELLAEIERLKAQIISQPAQASSITTATVKRTRAVVGPNGWTQEEY